jgi:predicted RNA binding protein YcfA (HicA-like mRNA interferase family)
VPTWKELKRFCENDGWELYKDGDHSFYRKRDENGNLRLTKVSRGSGEIEGAHLWNSILKKQLQVTKEYFNSKL